MKRYLIPAIVIVLVGVGTYFWTSHVSARHALLKTKRAHLDSLLAVQVERLKAVTHTVSAIVTHDSVADTIGPQPGIGDLWSSKHLDLMPDSIRPKDFRESTVHYGFDNSGDDNPNVVEDTTGAVDSAATVISERDDAFVKYTVMKMLMRHLIGSLAPEDFSRCPSGYFFALNYGGYPRIPIPEWDSGTVYFGAGCEDTTLCNFRFNYAKRIVQMKDIQATRFVSLREYELAKFSQYADLRRKDIGENH
jgi:hypothetical protein